MKHTRLAAAVRHDPELMAAILAYAEERGLLLKPEAAADECYTESVAFLESLADHGIEATLVSGLRVVHGIITAGHYAARVGDDVWDWTARQFDAEAPVPLVTPWAEWRVTWACATEGWGDPLDGICGCPDHAGVTRSAP